MKNEHVKQTITTNEHDFAIVMRRLRLALGLGSDADVSRALGLSTSNFSNRKASNSLPFEAIVNLCLERSVSLDWLFSGKGETFTNDEPSKDEPSKIVIGFRPIDVFFFGEIMAEFGYSQSPYFDPEKESWKTEYQYSTKRSEDSFYGMIGATIYNKIGHRPEGKARFAALHREIVTLGEGTRLFNMQKEHSRRQKDV